MKGETSTGGCQRRVYNDKVEWPVKGKLRKCGRGLSFDEINNLLLLGTKGMATLSLWLLTGDSAFSFAVGQQLGEFLDEHPEVTVALTEEL